VPAAVVALLLVAAAGYVLLGSGADDARTGETVYLNIPANTSDLLDRGRDVPQIPDRLTGRVGDTLVIRNRDRATQVVAGYPISPGQTLRIPLNRAGSYETSCSAHRDDSIRMVITQ
jgi:hypothetical protein